MPLATDPDQTYKVVLKLDSKKADDAQMSLVCRFLPQRKAAAMRRLIREAYETKDNALCYELLSQAVGMAAVRWTNVVDAEGNEIAFTVDALLDVLTELELWEVAHAIPEGAILAEREKKASSSPSQSAGASSAQAAEAESASTSPTQANR